jgi:ribosomal protein S18 acetylase RimI-like enzyme
VATALLLASQDLGRKLGLSALELSTAIDNAGAQALYEKYGWVRDTEFHVFTRSLTD